MVYDNHHPIIRERTQVFNMPDDFGEYFHIELFPYSTRHEKCEFENNFDATFREHDDCFQYS